MRKSFILALCLSLSVFAAGCSRSSSTATHRSGGSQTAQTTTEAEGTEYETSSETTTASSSSASTSSSGSLYGSQSSSSDVTDTYPISRLEGANGFYRLESDGDTAASLWQNTAERTKVKSFNGKDYGYRSWEGAYLCAGERDPLRINVSGGQNLLFVYSKYNYQPEALKLYPLSQIGYGNEAIFHKYRIHSLDTFEGIDVSEANKSIESFNKAVKGTGVQAYPYETSANYEYEALLTKTKNKMIRYGQYSGTNYQEEEAEMYYTYYIAEVKNEVEAPLRKTTKGYFTTDFSNVPKGQYLLYDQVLGSYLINVQ